ncbi:MAG: helix-turn-helix domain-containing protein [Nitrospinaceae bacterium]
MPILSHNIKVIRKNLNCTQTTLADVLGIGFRTYVRYESGERDAPAGILIKLSRLGNVSLDRLLTTRLSDGDREQRDATHLPDQSKNLEVIGGSLNEGRIMFKGIREDFLITVTPEEKKLVGKFRKMSPVSREKCIENLEDLADQSARLAKKGGPKKKVPLKVLKDRHRSQLKKIARSLKKPSPRG